jgi:predicted N-acetyltransferase YhbS
MFDLDKVEIRRMVPSEAEIVAKVDSYAYQNDPIFVSIYQSNTEETRKKRETNLVRMYTNNPQDTFVALIEDKIVGLIRSFPCTGLFKDLSYSEGEYEHIIRNKIENLTQEQRRKWWLMTMKKHDLQILHTHVGPFAVLPNYQGMGIGSKLFQNYLSRLKGTSYFETFTEENAHFYVKRGHKIIAVDEVLGIKGYWLRRD